MARGRGKVPRFDVLTAADGLMVRVAKTTVVVNKSKSETNKRLDWLNDNESRLVRARQNVFLL